MKTLSVTLSAKLEKDLNYLVGSGYGSNKAEVICRAVASASEEEAIQTVLRAEREPGLRGDLRELAKKIK